MAKPHAAQASFLTGQVGAAVSALETHFAVVHALAPALHAHPAHQQT